MAHSTSSLFVSITLLSCLGCSTSEPASDSDPPSSEGSPSGSTPSGSTPIDSTDSMDGSIAPSGGSPTSGSGGAGAGGTTNAGGTTAGGGQLGTGGLVGSGGTASTGGSTADAGCSGEANYQLLWEDHFDGTELNSEYWNIERGGGSNWNNTAIDDSRVVEVSGGTLKLKAIKNPEYSGSVSGLSTIEKSHIWTGAVDTQRKVDWLYGKVEVRARLESAPRAWPAIWMMPTESVYGGNPDSGEIDIVERLNHDDYYYSTVHTEYHSDNRSDPERYTTESAATIDEWTLFAVVWDEEKIEFYRDGNRYHTFNRNGESTVGGLLRWPFDQEFYLILSQQIGGGWVDGEASSRGLTLQESDLPFQMEVDYVRVCQRAP